MHGCVITRHMRPTPTRHMEAMSPKLVLRVQVEVQTKQHTIADSSKSKLQAWHGILWAQENLCTVVGNVGLGTKLPKQIHQGPASKRKHPHCIA